MPRTGHYSARVVFPTAKTHWKLTWGLDAESDHFSIKFYVSKEGISMSYTS